MNTRDMIASELATMLLDFQVLKEGQFAGVEDYAGLLLDKLKVSGQHGLFFLGDDNDSDYVRAVHKGEVAEEDFIIGTRIIIED